MNDRISVTVTVGDRKVTLEGPSEFVREEVERLARMDSAASPAKASSVAKLKERDLIEEKKPSSHAETVAVLAYVLSQDGRAEFSGEDIRRAYLRAGRRPPKAMEQALRDAKNRFDYLEITGERGKYRLSDYGESVVRFDLPRAAK